MSGCVWEKPGDAAWGWGECMGVYYGYAPCPLTCIIYVAHIMSQFSFSLWNG